MKLRSYLVLGLAALALTACGGGGGGGDDSDGGGNNTPETTEPEQPQYDRSHLKQINANVVQLAGMTGEGATVAVFDTGIRATHETFNGRTVTGYDTLNNDSAIPNNPDYSGTALTDEAGHGTSVASLAVGKNVGVAPDAGLVSYKLVSKLSDTNGALGGAIRVFNTDEAITQALSNPEIDVLNFSTSIGLDISFEERTTSDIVIDGITKNDWVVVLAAGNFGGNTGSGAAFADHSEFLGQILVVGSVDDRNLISDFSSMATSSVDQLRDLGELSGVIEHFLVVRGQRVYAASRIKDDSYSYFRGTSFAAPQVSGAVAVLRAEFPDLDGSEVVDILLDSATDLGAPGIDGTYGSGLLNLEAAVQLAMKRTAPSDPPADGGSTTP